jgi:hypothetical protein
MPVSPVQLSPQPPKKDKKHHIIQQPQDYAEGGPQRIQIITKQGHEIIMFDSPSGNSKIQITTSDGGQQIVLDEQNKKLFIGVADGGTMFQIETDGIIQIKSRGDVFVDAPNIHLNCTDYDKAGDLQPSVPPKEPKRMG